MCRITGIWDNNLSSTAELTFNCERMRDTMTRGGPDEAGLYYDAQANLALGHRRLSIIDLTPTGSQPMSTPDGRYTICYNGEVYNYREVRRELEARGAVFRGASDTEVLLLAFVQWGPSCIERFIGMFAFAIWDKDTKRLYLCRDRLGVKPLYYYHDGGIFAFASELKALHAALGSRLEVDTGSLSEFLHYGYIAAPRCIYRHTHKLLPGHWLVVDREHKHTHHCYWTMQSAIHEPVATLPEETLTNQLEELMVDAFTKRLIADVPVGVFLSGGIDSSLVTAILARHTKTPIKTFTIGFTEKNYDESGWARRIADYLKTEHTQEIVTPDHARAILPLWPEIYDEPFGDISGIPTTIVSQITRKHVKVSLSADGGDELFCGYHRYWVMRRLDERLKHISPSLAHAVAALIKTVGIDATAALASLFPRLRLPAIKDRLRKFQAVLAHWQGSAAGSYPYAVGYWLPQEIPALTGAYEDPRRKINPDNLLPGMMHWDLAYYLPDDILTKVDRATMHASLEGRDPFLDHRIVEFALKLPMNLKFQNGAMKYILRKVLNRYLPRELFERPKQGFAVPIYSWLHNDLMHMVDTYLNPDALKSQTLINPEPVLKTVAEFKAKSGSIAVDRLWLVLVFMMWRQRYA